MEQFKTQTKVIFSKNMALHLRSRTFFINLYIPILCTILSLVGRTDFLPLLYLLRPLYMTLILNGIVRQTVNLIVDERSGRHKEIQRIMGMSSNSYYCGWILIMWLLAIVISMIYVLPVIISGVYSTRDCTLNIGQVIISYILYTISLCNMMLFLSSMFENSKTASEVLGVFNVIASMVVSLVFVDTNVRSWVQIPLLFLPQSTIQLSWFSENWYVDGSNEFTMNFWVYMVVLILQTVGYLVAFLYLDQIIAHEHGAAKHPLFFLKWFQQNRVYQDLEEDLLENNNNQQIIKGCIQEHSVVEETPLLEIEGLFKRKNGQQILNAVSFELYQNEIFCLLGPNGAGKSTMTNIIAGITNKTSGTMKVCGVNTDTNSDYRKFIGICTQKDVLYGDLTVIEHLYYYARLKMVDNQIIDGQIQNILQKCLLADQAGLKTSQLSGGNKRKLCLALALLGESKIIILDEPSSGLDPVTREQLWAVIREMKVGRCILMTTHHLDEAEELAQRVAILINGAIATLGSVDFIKLTFGVGYHIDMEFQSSELLESNRLKVQTQVQSIERAAEITQVNTHTIKTVLPVSKLDQLHSLFSYLESQVPCKISMQMNSLEDSYLAVEARISNQVVDNDAYKIFMQQPNQQFWQQVKAMLYRKHKVITSSKGKIFRYCYTWPLIWLGVYAGNTSPFLFMLTYMLAKSLSMTSALSLPLEEKENKVKQYLHSAGVSVSAYWIGTALYDVIPCILEATLTALLLFAYEVGFWSRNVMLTLLVLSCFGLALNQLAYFLTLFFNKPLSAYLVMPLLSFIVLFLLMLIPMQLAQSYYSSGNALGAILMIFSPFQAGFIGMALSPMQLSLITYSVGSCILWMAIGSSFYLTMLIQMESKSINPVTNAAQLNDNVAVSATQLTKRIGDQIILNEVTLQVQKKEIYGLLGPNGAGKSTTFNVLTGFDKPTSGNIFIDSESKNVGTVPQFCPFYPELSIQEHLRIYGIAKGQLNLEETITAYLKAMNLEGIKDRQVMYLSGGERRKVQIGICLMGGSNRLFMDEPTTGLDPKSKIVVQQMLVASAQHNDASVVLTTHSMAEAQKICNRVGILINGTIICSGSIEELRVLFGNYIRVSIQCNVGRQAAVNQLVNEQLGQHVQVMPIQDFRLNYLSYQFAADQIKLSHLYYFLQNDLKKKHQLIVNYQVYQTTLDQIFAFFAQQQQPLIMNNQNADQEGLNQLDVMRIITGGCCCLFW